MFNKVILWSSVALTMAVTSVRAEYMQAVASPTAVLAIGIEGSGELLIPGFDLNADGVFEAKGGNLSDPYAPYSFEIKVDPDPFISASFSMLNNTAVTQTYSVTVLLGVLPAVTPLSLRGGSIGVSLTDANFNGTAQFSDAGSSIYTGLADGLPALSLFANPYVLQTVFPGQTVTASAMAGLPGPSIPGGPVISSIGIQHRFKLSPGDAIGITSFFVVESVPEINSLWIVAILCSGVGLWKRRELGDIIKLVKCDE